MTDDVGGTFSEFESLGVIETRFLLLLWPEFSTHTTHLLQSNTIDWF